MTSAPAMLRLFFALWPDQATREALTRLLSTGNGRPVAPENLHLTMAFLGMQPADTLPVLEALLDDIRLPALRLQLDRYGYFSRARIAWIGTLQPPQPLLELQSELSAALRQCGIGHDRESAFRPHVTLARNAGSAPQGKAPVIDWREPTLALVQSTTTPRGPIYQVLAQRSPD